MKIVQTYWTKPMFQKSGDLYNRLQGGWPSLKYALCAMVYSCLSIKKYYPNIELVTDTYGYKLLIEEFGLPYTKVNLSLNNFDADPNLWALAKVYSYGLQNEPFIHIDNDIFIWGKFPERIEKASLCCQNLEQLSLDYQEGLNLIKTHIPSKSNIFNEFIDNNNLMNLYAVNAGILGGNDIDFIKTYSKNVLDFYNHQINKFSLIGEKIGLLNIILEQLSFGVLAQKKGIKIEYLKQIIEFDELINDIIDIYSAPIRTKYVHCLGNIKKDLLVAQQIEFHLKSQYPNYYQKVLDYCYRNGFSTDIDLIRYNKFNDVFNLLSSYESVELFMDQVKFRIKPNLYILGDKDTLCLRTPTEDIPLSGWGKMMAYIKNYKTGRELSEELHIDLNKYFCKEEIQENVFSYLLHTLYRGNLIDYLV